MQMPKAIYNQLPTGGCTKNNAQPQLGFNNRMAATQRQSHVGNNHTNIYGITGTKQLKEGWLQLRVLSMLTGGVCGANEKDDRMMRKTFNK